MVAEADMRYLLSPDFIPLWNVGCFAVEAEYRSEDISRGCDELTERILPLAKGEDIEDFYGSLALINSIEEKASEVRAIESLLLRYCQELRENLTKIKEGLDGEQE